MVTESEFLARHPDAKDLSSSNETRWASARGNGGTGVRGGGDWRMSEFRARREELLIQGGQLILSLESIDWANHPNASVRRLFVERILPADPVRQIRSWPIYFSESCQDRQGREQTMVFVENSYRCCINPLSFDFEKSAWPEILANGLGDASLSTVLADIPPAEVTAGSGLGIARAAQAAWNLAIPASEPISESAQCKIPSESGMHRISVAELASHPTRRHPDGRWIILYSKPTDSGESDAYAICL